MVACVVCLVVGIMISGVGVFDLRCWVVGGFGFIGG